MNMRQCEPIRTHVNGLYDMWRIATKGDEQAVVGIVDDRWNLVEALARGLALRGFRVVGFDIDGLSPAAELQQRELANRVTEAGLDIAVVDSGIGNVDGLALVRRLREKELLTILLTGASPTQENYTAADRFVRKPVLASELGSIIHEMLGIIPEELTEGDYR